MCRQAESRKQSNRWGGGGQRNPKCSRKGVKQAVVTNLMFSLVTEVCKLFGGHLGFGLEKEPHSKVSQQVSGYLQRKSTCSVKYSKRWLKRRPS